MKTQPEDLMEMAMRMQRETVHAVLERRIEWMKTAEIPNGDDLIIFALGQFKDSTGKEWHVTLVGTGDERCEGALVPAWDTHEDGDWAGPSLIRLHLHIASELFKQFLAMTEPKSNNETTERTLTE